MTLKSDPDRRRGRVRTYSSPNIVRTGLSEYIAPRLSRRSVAASYELRTMKSVPSMLSRMTSESTRVSYLVYSLINGKHLPYFLLHSRYVSHEYSLGVSSKLPMNGRPGGPGGRGNLEVRRKRWNTAAVVAATKKRKNQETVADMTSSSDGVLERLLGIYVALQS